jgi:hypothetical protein
VARQSLALDPWPITASPDNIVLIVAGGSHPTNSYWLQGYSPGVVGREVHVPEHFGHLLDDTSRDLDTRHRPVKSRRLHPPDSAGRREAPGSVPFSNGYEHSP